MSEGFDRTRQTAAEARANARLLRRAVVKATGADKERLDTLALRYEEYAVALLVGIPRAAPEPDEDQPPLI